MNKQEKIITLSFSPTITRLAGNEFGQEIFSNQVKSVMDLEYMNVIVIPENIQNIAISFVQGFTNEIFKMINKGEFYTYFKIQASEKVINKFNKSIYY